MQDKQACETGWTLDIKNSSWTEDTENQVEFIIKTMQLCGGERILDLACGYGRHALALARRGFDVVGVDFTPSYIDDAISNAPPNARFICADIRDVGFEGEFDVVLNMGGGAIGYFETDEENLKTFDVIARALKPGGKHFMDVCNAEHAERHFPKRHWEVGKKALALAEFEWFPETRRWCYNGWDILFGEVAQPPAVKPIKPGTRLYTKNELREILRARGMEIDNTFSNYYGNPDTRKELQLMVCSRKK